MKLKDLKVYCGKIFVHCANVERQENMLIALEEDLAIDRYQDTQPGGGNCESDNLKKQKECKEMLSELTVETVFGELYQKATPNERKLLESLIDACIENHKENFFIEVDLTYQMLEFLKRLCELDFAEKEFSADDINLILDGGKFFEKCVEGSFDEEQEKFLLVPGTELANEFLLKNVH